MFDDIPLAQSAVGRFANNAYDLVIEGDCGALPETFVFSSAKFRARMLW